jgi:hypothetical protein
MAQTTDSAARSNENNEQPSQGGQVQYQLSLEQFNGELDKNVALLLTQEEYKMRSKGRRGKRKRG